MKKPAQERFADALERIATQMEKDGAQQMKVQNRMVAVFEKCVQSILPPRG